MSTSTLPPLTWRDRRPAVRPAAPVCAAPAPGTNWCQSTFGHRRSPMALATVLALHLMGVWALLQLGPVRQAIHEAAPLMVRIAGPEVTAPMPPKPLPTPKLPAPPPLPMPAVPAVPSVERTVPDAAPSPQTVSAPQPEQHTAEATPTLTMATPTAAAPVPTAPPVPRQLPPSAVQYLVPPQADYPRASRRLRETGRVVVRVLIGTSGLPERVQVEKSSGHPLLDDAALNAVRQARFKPYIENGQPQPGWALIPLSFDLDN
jgi:protein TonB